MDSKTRYVLITPVRNEEAFIEKPLRAVVAQTIPPARWAIVSDGSTDRTDEIVQSYADRFEFITLLRRDEDKRRSFGSKALAFKVGYDSIKDLDFDFIGNLDADISFAPDYYERIMERLAADPKLGITGGIAFSFEKGQFVRVVSSLNHASGPVQFFRRECYDQIGGFPPLRHGGIDSAAIVNAQMKGWRVRSFEDILVYHHRPEGHHAGGYLKAHFQAGRKEYALGSRPSFALLKSVRRFQEHPLVLGGMVRYAGFLRSFLAREKREVSPEFVQFVRADQKRRMKALIWPFGNRNSSEDQKPCR
jgi:biofilm PGA synthesis N-glycosyltransferase PgaC